MLTYPKLDYANPHAGSAGVGQALFRTLVRNMVVLWFALCLMAILVQEAQGSGELDWISVPHLRSFSSAEEMRRGLPGMYAEAKLDLLLVVGNSVFGNPCASLDVRGVSETPETQGATAESQVQGSAAVSRVAGAAAESEVGGFVGTAQVGGFAGDVQVGGAQGRASVGGAARSSRVSGASDSSAVAGATQEPAVAGTVGELKCARTPDNLDYLLVVPLAQQVLAFDGQELYPVNSKKVVSAEPRSG